VSVGGVDSKLARNVANAKDLRCQLKKKKIEKSEKRKKKIL